MDKNIRNIIQSLARPDTETTALICTVDAVDKEARTADCSTINEGAPLLGVNLQANQGSDFGLCLFPEVGSYVVVGFVADGAAGVILLYDKIESAEIKIGDISAMMDQEKIAVKAGDISARIDPQQITFNGGSLGGLVKIEELTKRLNIIENDLNTLKTIFSTAWSPVSQDGGAALKTAAQAWAMQTLKNTVTTDYENIKVKH